MSGILKLWKKIKWIRRIIAIASIVTTVVSVYLWFSDITVYADVRKQEDVGKVTELKDGSTAHGPRTPSQQAIADTAKDIALFYKSYRDKNTPYTYDKWNGPWDEHYRDAKNLVSCCSIYVLQVLIDLQLTDSFGGYDCRIFMGIL